MSLRPILTLPDPRLRQTCAPVAAFDADLEALVADMFETMYAAPGRGLAAPQVGVMRRLFVMDVGWKEGASDPRVFVNPRIVPAEGGVTAVMTEQCLSIPDRAVRLERPARVRLCWQDTAGRADAAEFDGFAARCIQHECDHLDGLLCIDRPEATEGGAP